MPLYDIAFYYFAVVVILTALLAVSRRNPVHSVLFLVPCFFHVAGIFVLLSAEFLAVVQILVPAGALMVLYLFVVFLFSLHDVKVTRSAHRQAAAAAVISLALVVLLTAIAVGGLFPMHFPGQVPGAGVDNVTAVGGSLFTKFLFPFELASLVLLVIMFGAIVLARRERSE
jgi:NADH-quinone oxidoreductase subunit J